MRLLVCISLLLLPALSWAEIYRWTDANGQIHFGEQPGAGAQRIEVKPQVVERDAATREREERLRKVLDARSQEQAAVQQNKVGQPAAGQMKAGLGIFGHQHVIMRLGQPDLQHDAVRHHVVNDKDPARHWCLLYLR